MGTCVSSIVRPKDEVLVLEFTFSREPPALAPKEKSPKPTPALAPQALLLKDDVALYDELWYDRPVQPLLEAKFPGMSVV